MLNCSKQLKIILITAAIFCAGIGTKAVVLSFSAPKALLPGNLSLYGIHLGQKISDCVHKDGFSFFPFCDGGERCHLPIPADQDQYAAEIVACVTHKTQQVGGVVVFVKEYETAIGKLNERLGGRGEFSQDAHGNYFSYSSNGESIFAANVFGDWSIYHATVKLDSDTSKKLLADDEKVYDSEQEAIEKKAKEEALSKANVGL